MIFCPTPAIAAASALGFVFGLALPSSAARRAPESDAAEGRTSERRDLGQRYRESDNVRRRARRGSAFIPPLPLFSPLLFCLSPFAFAFAFGFGVGFGFGFGFGFGCQPLIFRAV
ncbi:hypothetical protein PQS31_09680 [Luteimonas sp BLCC-B24]|uniref:hypothetical protein n=1 Tax=Luteimonas sp. BLCC-B24 TaxID=3025317 RepID=UPI00234D7FE0|nr:hypothetical protein [Luteimonas sp. BLCC-B24]MDC7807090.1 hypothetical protein [Luteimonas sp. BLCC-B24]